MNISSRFKYNSKTFSKYINDKTKMRLSIPNLSIGEKADVNTENKLEIADVSG